MYFSEQRQTFLGLDLAWYGDAKTSAFAVLEGDSDGVRLNQVLEELRGDQEIVDAIATTASTNTVLAIDAPLVIQNVNGQRPCETEIGRRFGRADASAHTSNLTRFPKARGVALAERLMTAGWQHDVNPAIDRQRLGRWLFEVYPHPAHVVLFDRARIIKYKKGPLAARRRGLTELRETIASELGAAMPTLLAGATLKGLLEKSLDRLSGPKLKGYEDALDSLLCGFIAAHYWTWGVDRNEMIGSMDQGYIVTPSRTAKGAAWSFAMGPV